MALPTPTALATSTRYIPAGVRRTSWVPTIATKGAPSSAELTAGTDLTGQIVADGITGFNTMAASVDVPDYGSTYTSKIPGMVSSDDSSIKLYLSTNATDARALLTATTNGFIVTYPEGIVSSGKCSVFPVRIGSFTVDQVQADAPATGTATFYVTSVPVENIAIPTA